MNVDRGHRAIVRRGLLGWPSSIGTLLPRGPSCFQRSGRLEPVIGDALYQQHSDEYPYIGCHKVRVILCHGVTLHGDQGVEALELDLACPQYRLHAVEGDGTAAGNQADRRLVKHDLRVIDDELHNVCRIAQSLAISSLCDKSHIDRSVSIP